MTWSPRFRPTAGTPTKYYDPEPGVPGRSVSKWGAFLDDVAGFDSEFFGINEREAIALDPQHRLLLETSWEAMEHAGLTRETMTDSMTGVFVGLTHYDYQLVTADSHAMEGPYGFTGNTFSMASGRIAYALGVHGPAVTVDTACSSSLLAVHMACRSLNDGESDLALAGGAFVMLEPRKFLAQTGAGPCCLPPDAVMRSTSRPTGTCAARASAVVLLKRLPDALADGDRILAVVRGTAANQDGHTVNIATPSLSAQTAAYRAALAAAGVDARSVGMVEAHGPGTPVGDPIEYGSLAEVYGVDGPCALASVKTNFGHAQSASGALGLMKAVLALQHGVVPQNLHFTRLPDELARIDTKLFVPQEITPWPANGHAPRRAAVSSYGLSGTNVHAIVEQAPEQAPEAAAPEDISARSTESSMTAALLFPLSSTSADELRRTAGRLADWVAAHADVALPDLAYTLARRRAHRPVRTAVIASSLPELTEALREVADGDTPYQAAVGRDDRGPVWVFSGQGSQWAAMGADLLATEPVFAATVAQAEPLIARESGFSVTEAMTAPQVVTGIDRIQPTLFTMQVALAATMRSYGVRPGAVIGHSLGEAAAAVVAGALSLDDGVRVICRRSRLMSRIAGSGAMASVELPAKQVLSELTARGVDDVVVAVVASPQSTVIGGATQTVRELVAAWEQREVMAREIAVDVASHSPQVDPILDELTDVLAELNPMTPEVPFYSSTLFDPREQPMCDNRYWVDNLRHTVRFAAGGAGRFGGRLPGLRASWHPTPCSPTRSSRPPAASTCRLAALAGMRREQALPRGLRGLLADLHSAGAAVDFAVLYPNGRLVDAPLPTWTHRRLWLTRDGQESPTPGGCTVSVHPLLGPHVRLQEEPERHVWEAEVGTAAQPWLAEHHVHDVAVLPAAAYCEMALAAARAVLGEAAEVRDIRFEQALLLDEQTTVGASASMSSAGVLDFIVETNQGGEQARHASAVLHAATDEQPPAQDMSALLAAHPGSRGWRRGAQGPGPAWCSVRCGVHRLAAVHTATGRRHRAGRGRAARPNPLAARRLRRAPRTAGCLFSVRCGSSRRPGYRRGRAGVAAGCPAATRLRFRPHRPLLLHTGDQSRRLRHRGRPRRARPARDGPAEPCRGCDWAPEHSGNARNDRVLDERLLTIEWRQRELPEADHTDAGSWLLISTTRIAEAVANTLTGALQSHGAHCTTMCWPPDADGASNGNSWEISCVPVDSAVW